MGHCPRALRSICLWANHNGAIKKLFMNSHLKMFDKDCHILEYLYVSCKLVVIKKIRFVSEQITIGHQGGTKWRNSRLTPKNLYYWLGWAILASACSYLDSLVMSPSRAGSSHSSRWRIFSSARLVTFFIQLEIENWPKMSRTFDFFFMINYFDRIGLKMIKFCT